VGKHAYIRAMPYYWILGSLVWLALFESGVHATLTGVALGLLTPTRPFYSSSEFDRRAHHVLNLYPPSEATVLSREQVDHEVLSLAGVVRESASPLSRLEESPHPWTSFLVVPLFALANAGVRFAGIDLGEAITHPVTIGVGVGLVVGKVVGISVFTGLSIRFGLGRLPPGTTWSHVAALATLAGIGFTVSLFVTGLAFTDPVLTDLAKIGIFLGSTAAGVAGYLLLRRLPAEATR
ncbi:MAG: Na+/H+ antiporter NhaA, partial [Acidimicrobiia bacterium]